MAAPEVVAPLSPSAPWDPVRLGEVASFSKGSGLSKSEVSATGRYPCILYGELFTQYGPVIKEPVSRTDSPPRVVSQIGDVLMPTSDVTPTGLAKASALRRQGVGLGGDILIIRPDPERLLPEFLAYSIRFDASQVLSFARGSTVFHLYASDMRNFMVSLPPLREQRRIVEVLSDIDALVTSLNQFIEKKRMLARGLLQALITGQRRLPGFTEPWRMHRLGKCAVIGTGSRDNQDKDPYGKYPFFVRSPIVEKINTYSFEGEAILIPGEGNIGSIIHYINGRFDFHQRVYKLSNFTPNVDGRFLYYALMHGFGAHAIRNSVKATVDSLRKPAFESFEFRAPLIDEQRAIASVLTDTDREIEALIAQRDKTAQLQEALRQQLLTGRTHIP